MTRKLRVRDENSLMSAEQDYSPLGKPPLSIWTSHKQILFRRSHAAAMAYEVQLAIALRLCGIAAASFTKGPGAPEVGEHAQPVFNTPVKLAGCPVHTLHARAVAIAILLVPWAYTYRSDMWWSSKDAPENVLHALLPPQLDSTDRDAQSAKV